MSAAATGLKQTLSMTLQSARSALPPIIVTAHVPPDDMDYFDRLRREHFPPERNYLKAHITIFHHLPGRVLEEAMVLAAESVDQRQSFHASISGIRHLGAGVAFDIESPELQELRADLFQRFGSWPGPQDRQKFKPHITVQNKVSRAGADRLYAELLSDFQPRHITVSGLDLWSYLGGPWEHKAFLPLRKKFETVNVKS